MENLHSFEDKIDFLSKNANTWTDINNYLQPPKLDSKKMNSFLSFLDMEINNLYEKSRVMEEILDEAELYFNTIVSGNQHLIYDKLRPLEEDRDSIKKKLYKESLVDITGYTTGNDRDNDVLPVCEIFNSHITVSGNEINDIFIDEISVKSNSVPYKQNLEELKDDMPYRVLYVIDSEIEGGIAEEIKIDFDTPTAFNYLRFEPSNAKLHKIIYENEDGTITTDNKVYDVYKNHRRINSATFVISSTNMVSKTYEVDRVRIYDDFWTIVNDHSFNHWLTGETDPLDIEEYSGMKQYEKDLRQYEIDWLEWDIERKATEEYNHMLEREYRAEISSWSRELDRVRARNDRLMDSYYDRVREVERENERIINRYNQEVERWDRFG